MLLFLTLTFAFLAGAMLTLAIGSLRGAERRATVRRLDALPLRQEALRSLAEEELEGSWQERFLRPVVARLAGWGMRLTPTGASARLRGALTRAGSPANLGVGEFAGLRAVSAGLGLLLALLLCSALPPSVGVRGLALLFGLMAGLTLPESLLEQAVRRREALIRKALPEVIDLLVVSVEAGMSLDGAMAKVTEKLSGPLAEEMARARHETQIGKTRAQALKDMAARLEMREIKTFVAAVAQADQLGTSIVGVLRAQSVMARAAKVQRVREQAARLPVTMLFPLVFFVFPAVFVVLLGPSLIRLAAVLGAPK